MSYVDIEAFKVYLKVNRNTDPDDDAILQAALDAAEQTVNKMTGRTFAMTSTAEDRVFPGTGSVLLDVDDFTTLNTVTVDGTLLDGGDYQPVRVASGEAYSQIARSSCWSTSTFPNIAVNAVWGWVAIPAPVRQACMIVAKDIAAMQDVSFGIAQFTDYAGIRTKENPFVRMLLAPYDIRVFLG